MLLWVIGAAVVGTGIYLIATQNQASAPAVTSGGTGNTTQTPITGPGAQAYSVPTGNTVNVSLPFGAMWAPNNQAAPAPANANFVVSNTVPVTYTWYDSTNAPQTTTVTFTAA